MGVALGCLLLAAPTGATVLTAELRVNGLSCPFCAFGIEKKLLEVDGVQDVEVFLDEGRLTLTFEADNEATVADLAKAVEKAGFELAGLSLTVRGRVVDGAEGGPVLVANPRMRFHLAERHGKATQSISTSAVERLRGSAGSSNPVVVTGEVQGLDETEATLVVAPAARSDIPSVVAPEQTRSQ